MLRFTKNNLLKDIFTMGICDNEIIPGGALTEYRYKKELAGLIAAKELPKTKIILLFLQLKNIM